MRIFNQTKTEELIDFEYNEENGYLVNDTLTIKPLEEGGNPTFERILVYISYPESFKKRQRVKALNERYIPETEKSTLALLRSLSKTVSLNDEQKMTISGIYDEWKRGKYEKGDCVNYAGQTFECHQAHDNAIHPDIRPDNASTWATFWRPLHGKSKETARPWVKPMYGTTDMYHAGEYMIYEDGEVYKCVMNTVYTPIEFSAGWEKQ